MTSLQSYNNYMTQFSLPVYNYTLFERNDFQNGYSSILSPYFVSFYTEACILLSWSLIILNK
jgi:hypothetical protein